MKAIHIVKHGKSANAFELRDIEIPKPDKGEVTIKVSCFGLNFADVLARRGLYPDAPKPPSVIGYDVAGYIHEVGKDVTDLKKGDRVTALTRFGGYAEYATTMVEAVSKIPEAISLEESTALTTQGCTAYYCAEESVQLHQGDHVLIQAAAGGVGTMMVQYAKHKGCIVYGTASTKKQEYLKEIGVDHPIDYTSVDFKSFIQQKNNGDKQCLDFVFDSIGGKSFSKGYKLLKPSGKIVFFGAANQLGDNGGNIIKTLGVAAGFGFFSPLQLIMESRSMIGVNMLRIADNKPNIFNHCLTKVIELANQGILKPTIGKVFDASDIAEAHDYLETRKSIGKVVMTWS